MVSIKGTILLTSRELARHTHDEAGLNKVLNTLDEQDRKIVTTAIANGWYPMDTYAHWLHGEINELCGGDEKVFMEQRVKTGVEKQFKGIYKVFLHLGSPEKVLQRLSYINNQYFKGISTKVTVIEKGKVLLTYTGLEKHHAVFELIIKGWWEGILQLIGAKDINFTIKTSVDEGKGHSEFILSWKK